METSIASQYDQVRAEYQQLKDYIENGYKDHTMIRHIERLRDKAILSDTIKEIYNSIVTSTPLDGDGPVTHFLNGNYSFEGSDSSSNDDELLNDEDWQQDPESENESLLLTHMGIRKELRSKLAKLSNRFYQALPNFLTDEMITNVQHSVNLRRKMGQMNANYHTYHSTQLPYLEKIWVQNTIWLYESIPQKLFNSQIQKEQQEIDAQISECRTKLLSNSQYLQSCMEQGTYPKELIGGSSNKDEQRKIIAAQYLDHIRQNRQINFSNTSPENYEKISLIFKHIMNTFKQIKLGIDFSSLIKTGDRELYESSLDDKEKRFIAYMEHEISQEGKGRTIRKVGKEIEFTTFRWQPYRIPSFDNMNNSF